MDLSARSRAVGQSSLVRRGYWVDCGFATGGEDSVQQDLDGPVETGRTVAGDEFAAEAGDVGETVGIRRRDGGEVASRVFRRFRRGVFHGARGWQQHEQVDTPGCGPVGRAALVQQRQNRLDQRHVVRAARLRLQRHSGDVWAGPENLDVTNKQRLHPVLPRPGDRWGCAGGPGASADLVARDRG
jgi:hypothetical protein